MLLLQLLARSRLFGEHDPTWFVVCHLNDSHPLIGHPRDARNRMKLCFSFMAKDQGRNTHNFSSFFTLILPSYLRLCSFMPLGTRGGNLFHSCSNVVMVSLGILSCLGDRYVFIIAICLVSWHTAWHSFHVGCPSVTVALNHLIYFNSETFDKGWLTFSRDIRENGVALAPQVDVEIDVSK